MQSKSCFLIGHRDTPETIFPYLLDAVETHIAEYGVTEFVVGHYGNFDRLAARALIAAKYAYPEITLMLLLPYHPAERPIKIPTGFDNTYYPFGMESVPRKLAIARANRYMVEHVDHLIAYSWQSASNTAKLVQYAKRISLTTELNVFNIADRIIL